MIKPTINLQELQARIGHRAKSAPAHRFWGLFVHITKVEVLEYAYLEAKGNRGAPGSDGVTFENIEHTGRDAFLREIAAELRAGTYKSLPYRKVEIPKDNGKARTLSIAAIRDRVVQGAVKAILEPIFEADFLDCSFGARPGRRAHEAIEVTRKALLQRKHYVADVDLSAFFDNIVHTTLLARVARRIQDPQMLAMLKWFLKGAGKRGVPQGSPLSPLLANLALDDLDHALERGQGFITYVRYLDDMVVLAHNTPKGRLWVNRALIRIKQEADAVGVKVNEEKTRVVCMTEAKASFAFLGFELRWKRSPKTGKWYPDASPRRKKVIAVQAQIREVLNRSSHLEVVAAVARINPILRGWANYFRTGNSSRAFDKVREYVERRVRRFAAKQRQRRGFGWKRWSSKDVYQEWGLYKDYKIRYYAPAKVSAASQGIITSVR
jgi:RNA-directed DNA polymerase